jgi:hypothetical protein
MTQPLRFLFFGTSVSPVLDLGFREGKENPKREREVGLRLDLGCCIFYTNTYENLPKALRSHDLTTLDLVHNLYSDQIKRFDEK